MYDSLNPIKIPKKPKKWTAFKWVLLLTNTVLMCMGIVGMVLSVLTWYKLYIRAAVVLVVSRGTVILITTVSSCAIAVALLGYCGIFFNSRRILTVYSILLWPLMGGLASIGYVTFKFSQWNLEDKLRSNWKHEVYSVDDRMRIQANLHCCGFDLPNDGSEVITNKCHSDTKVKMYGCRYKLFRMVDTYLTNTYITAFSFLVPHVFILFASLLCSNHITENFGTEPAPKLNYHQE
ncbi:hypothetical protein K493DRAFT_218169 [Basidiobolus meristosporus CBS 931.73]|uniref:Tetraspanin Tsp2 n=1 Tax=Basidiobolus meristosporus CBS 931.73 TaxID=1314790 RepID=A0A1Y1YDJ8_9FUNG|nr:hypothetical protein K493DRAFT_218169 [Basidiobolus meristosporus CBS 931.73]|eukprot:ORX96048.1 hypothetical protein K493DRAFT_218169 [Basidiobolus meristosporus CBS 931.73]